MEAAVEDGFDETRDDADKDDVDRELLASIDASSSKVSNDDDATEHDETIARFDGGFDDFELKVVEAGLFDEDDFDAIDEARDEDDVDRKLLAPIDASSSKTSDDDDVIERDDIIVLFDGFDDFDLEVLAGFDEDDAEPLASLED